MLDHLCEIIMPADDQSPGARQAQVRFYIDVMVHFADAQNQGRWKAGLRAVDEAAVKFMMNGALTIGTRSNTNGQQQDILLSQRRQ